MSQPVPALHFVGGGWVSYPDGLTKKRTHPGLLKTDLPCFFVKNRYTHASFLKTYVRFCLRADADQWAQNRDFSVCELVLVT